MLKWCLEAEREFLKRCIFTIDDPCYVRIFRNRLIPNRSLQGDSQVLPEVLNDNGFSDFFIDRVCEVNSDNVLEASPFGAEHRCCDIFGVCHSVTDFIIVRKRMRR